MFAVGRPSSVLVYLLGMGAIGTIALWGLTVGGPLDGFGRFMHVCGVFLGGAGLVATSRAWILLRRDPAMIAATADELHVLDSGWMWPRRTSVHADEIDQVQALEYWFGRVHGQQLRVRRRRGRGLFVISPWTGQPAADLKRSIETWLGHRGVVE